VTRRARSTTLSSPVLVGAVTVLIVIVAVFLAYNANSGLPFIPTYDLKAVLPSGGKLVRGNDVRIAGFRVGVVKSIDFAVRRVRGRRRAVALVGLKLDKSVEPLPADTRVRVRPRSPLGGLKYVEVTPGLSSRTLIAGATIPLRQASEPLEFEDVYGTFQPGARDSLRKATQGFGDALAGRGEAVNEAIASFAPLLRHLTPVARTLADPSSDLRGFVRGLADTFGELAPVAGTLAELMTNGADTFAALNRSPAALQATIERLPPTFEVGERALRITRPGLAEAADLERRLRPAARELPRSLPALNRALAVGTPVLLRSVALSQRLGQAARALRDLVRDPNTLMALGDLRTALALLHPLIEFIAPYQTVCDYTVYFANALGEHQSQPGPGGNVQQQLSRRVNMFQPNSLGTTFNARPWDITSTQAKQGVQGAMVNGFPAGRAIGPPYQPAIDAQGNADCQNGQDGFPNFRLLPSFVRKNHQSSTPNDPNDVTTGELTDGTPAGGNATVALSNYPGLSGPTYNSIKNKIRNLRDVP
jgi:phospholipid/cholesterol/gamma-HCH transport system substrate-binding protein